MAPALPSDNLPATNWLRKISPSSETDNKKETITQSIQARYYKGKKRNYWDKLSWKRENVTIHRADKNCDQNLDHDFKRWGGAETETCVVSTQERSMHVYVRERRHKSS